MVVFTPNINQFYSVWARYNQITLIFAENGSEGFEKLYELLGDRIRLKGWEKFKGGLDTKSESLYTWTRISKFNFEFLSKTCDGAYKEICAK